MTFPENSLLLHPNETFHEILEYAKELRGITLMLAGRVPIRQPTD